ncbi:MAG TPA: phage holin family protein [Steroidobacteraceae bacterium]|nr:phage holin family protein [Steroidobacteraceae bacterium]
MRGLWSLPKAAPALMRHIGAYIELAGLDLARTHREITAQVVASAIVAICVLFAVFLICLGIIAYYWDTPYRVAAIAWMAGGFLVAAIAAAVYRARAARARSPLLSDVRREWQEDRVILEKILSSDEN